VDGCAGDDATLRPNQVLAYSLPNGPLRGQRLPAAIGATLGTPLGLRSRASGDEAYRGAHRGGPAERDLAYHEGTVWPWLIGPYAAAIVKSRVELPILLGGIEAHLSEWGLGSVSETAEGDPPHRATGCPFQAWSVAEVLRAHRMDL
jgi:glycogen debranching enzyme